MGSGKSRLLYRREKFDQSRLDVFGVGSRAREEKRSEKSRTRSCRSGERGTSTGFESCAGHWNAVGLWSGLRIKRGVLLSVRTYQVV